MITRGTTPTHTFIIPIIIPELSIISIAYKQRESIKIDKCFDDCVITTDEQLVQTKIITTLTEQETLSLKEGSVLIQLRLGDSNGMRYASRIMKTNVADILKDGAL